MDERDGMGQVAGLRELTIRVIHDNYPCTEGLRTAWGFAALVEGARKTILFDTGSDGPLLLENMARLDIEPYCVDAVVLSHVHPDHTGGLLGLLERKPDVEVYFLASFPSKFKDRLGRRGAVIVEVRDSQELCPGVFTTGQLGRRIKEQALIMRTHRGLVLVMGCAHPGVARMIDKARSLCDEEILLVLGGFHLEWAFKHQIEKIITSFRESGVRHVAPTHCSGERAREMFRRKFGPRFVHAGVGKTLTLADLA
jgi:7,8-dihydropterin-6-yl-methyl-4-(beta-D-ribofuranosyl)aminobenzene 5'-phosphate synthase